MNIEQINKAIRSLQKLHSPSVDGSSGVTVRTHCLNDERFVAEAGGIRADGESVNASLEALGSKIARCIKEECEAEGKAIHEKLWIANELAGCGVAIAAAEHGATDCRMSLEDCLEQLKASLCTRTGFVSAEMSKPAASPESPAVKSTTNPWWYGNFDPSESE